MTNLEEIKKWLCRNFGVKKKSRKIDDIKNYYCDENGKVHRKQTTILLCRYEECMRAKRYWKGKYCSAFGYIDASSFWKAGNRVRCCLGFYFKDGMLEKLKYIFGKDTLIKIKEYENDDGERTFFGGTHIVVKTSKPPIAIFK